MNSIATITSKRQFTIPSSVFERAKLTQGQRLSITIADDNSITLRPVTDLVNQLAGSVIIPKGINTDNLDILISDAKQKYFKQSRI